MNTPQSNPIKNLTKKQRELPEIKSATLDPKLAIIRGIYWVIVAAAFATILSMQQAHGNPLHNIMAATQVVQSGIRVISEPSTLLNQLTDSERNKKSISINKLQKAFADSKAMLINGNTGALTLAEQSKMNEVTKKHHLQNIDFKNLQTTNTQINQSSAQTQKGKTLFNIIFGSSQTTSKETVNNPTYEREEVEAAHPEAEDTSTPSF